MTVVTTTALVVVALAAVLSTVRLVRGPSVPDRIVALDSILVCVVAGIAVYSVAVGEASYLALLVVVALLGFVATVTAARFVERRGK